MGLFIKNPEVERKARELAALTGESLTVALDRAIDVALEQERLKEANAPHDPVAKLARIKAATEAFRKAVGLDKRKLNVTKAEFDALWEIPGVTDRPDIP